jgi:hypothetical protein
MGSGEAKNPVDLDAGVAELLTDLLLRETSLVVEHRRPNAQAVVRL